MPNNVTAAKNYALANWPQYFPGGDLSYWDIQSPPSTNYALQASGGVATASSIQAAGYAASSANNGVRSGHPWGSGGGWMG